MRYEMELASCTDTGVLSACNLVQFVVQKKCNLDDIRCVSCSLGL